MHTRKVPIGLTLIGLAFAALKVPELGVWGKVFAAVFAVSAVAVLIAALPWRTICTKWAYHFPGESDNHSGKLDIRITVGRVYLPFDEYDEQNRSGRIVLEDVTLRNRRRQAVDANIRLNFWRPKQGWGGDGTAPIEGPAAVLLTRRGVSRIERLVFPVLDLSRDEFVGGTATLWVKDSRVSRQCGLYLLGYPDGRVEVPCSD